MVNETHYIWRKDFDTNSDKFGMFLMKAGLINENQLERALYEQQAEAKEHGKKCCIGEVIADLYSIPPKEIENLFIREYLMADVLAWFRKALAKDKVLNKQLKNIGIDFNRIVSNTEIRIYSWNITKSLFFEENGDNAESLQSVLSKIIAGKISFRVVLHNNQVIEKTESFSFETKSRKINLDMSSVIDNMRIEIIKAASDELKVKADPIKVSLSEFYPAFGKLGAMNTPAIQH
jgi:hypothetical protein